MTLRSKLSVWFGVVLVASLLINGALLYEEWVVEPRQGHHEDEETDGPPINDLWQAVLTCAIPAVLIGVGGGWLLMRRALQPVVALTFAAERVNENNLRTALPRTGNGDELDRLTAVFNNMTARLAASFERIREFTLRASHELKTPLTIMRANIETTIRSDASIEDQRGYLMDQVDEIDRLAKIVDGLTLLTKADAGEIRLKAEPVGLGELVQEVFADGQVLARANAISVELLALETATVTGDNSRLRQMLLNLVDNAVKYNVPQGSVSISLRSIDGAADIEITNTGAGIDQEMLPRVFDPFFRGDPSHTREVEGSGLGLAIVRWIVTAHGGRITLASEPGLCTRVRVSLPLAARGRGNPEE